MKTVDQVILETGRLLLREQVMDDLDDLWNFHCNPENVRYYHNAPGTREEVMEQLEWDIDWYSRNDGLGTWAIIHKETGKLAGLCSLMPWTLDGHEEVEMAYVLAEECRGQGLGTELSQGVIKYALESLKLPRIISLIEPDNMLSRHVVEKAGMRYEKDGYDESGPVVVYVVEKRRHSSLGTMMSTKRQNPEGGTMKPVYPHARTVEQVDDYHGTLVPDPYRWLEEVDSEETLAWIGQQNELTFSILKNIPKRPFIQNRLTQLWNFPKAWAPHKRGKWYFQLRNSGLQNQNILYVTENLSQEPRLLLDPNTLSEDGTVALTGMSISKDGSWIAYATSSSGSDWLTWHTRNVETGQDLDEVIEWSKFCNAAWMPDGSGFYYSRYDQPAEGAEFQNTNYNHKVFFHKLHTSQQQDRLVYERPDQREWGFLSEVTDDGCYHVLTVWQGTDVRNRIFYQDLQDPDHFIELISELEATYTLVGNDGTTFYFFTNLEAPRGRLIAIDIRHPDRHNGQTIIGQSDSVLEGIVIVNDQFAALYNEDAHHIVRLFKRDGSPDGEVPLPGLGSIVQINELGLHGSRADHELFLAFESFLYPTSVVRYDSKTRAVEALNSPELDFDPTASETRQVFVSSRDGTRIPMYLTHKKGLSYNGQNPTLLYGYGGFNVSNMPAFEIDRLVWLEMGGVYASANMRGGGEYGEEWHQSGMQSRKQNVFDDFIACAEWLIAEGITCPPRLAIQGRSNGGLLVGACMTQRPDLFGACIPEVGVMDMLRFHKFTIGWAWVSDYGTPDDPQQFKALHAYSPYHNLQPGTAYPATLVTTADHDDRVVPGHSFKFAARLQACQSGDAPVLIRIQTRAGHGFGKPTAIQIEERSDIYAFLWDQLQME